MTTIEKYRETLAKHAARQGLTMNPDLELILPLLEGLLRNGERYGLRTCPCRLASGVKEKDLDIVCPCAYAKPDVEEFGACYCGLFASQAWIDGTVRRVVVPERRPPEKTLA